MSPQKNPLETRSLPDGLWQYVPESFYQWDLSLQAKITSYVSVQESPWKEIEWLSEKPAGILTSMLLLLFIAVALSLKNKSHFWNKSSWLRTKTYFGHLVLLLPFLLLSDLFSTVVKLKVGRLKPHVNFYHPEYIPALSFPSSHALNSAFAFSLVYFSLAKETQNRKKPLVAFFLALLVCVGLTRILFGQHYPLDVAAGWFLGGTLGKILAPLYRSFSLRTVRK